jgi:hypothetical protein
MRRTDLKLARLTMAIASILACLLAAAVKTTAR